MKKLVMSVLLLAAGGRARGERVRWHVEDAHGRMKMTGKPDVIAVIHGMYICSSCVHRTIKVKADGTDQKVTGHPYYDTVAVAVVDPTSFEVTQQAGRASRSCSVTYTVSTDGNTLTGKFKDYTGTKLATGTFTENASRQGSGRFARGFRFLAAGALTDANDGGAAHLHYRMTDQQFSMHWNGQSYDAKFDGKQYPVQGDPGHTTVSLKRVDANTVEETDTRAGKVTDEIHFAAAADGKIDQRDRQGPAHDQITTFTSTSSRNFPGGLRERAPAGRARSAPAQTLSAGARGTAGSRCSRRPLGLSGVRWLDPGALQCARLRARRPDSSGRAR